MCSSDLSSSDGHVQGDTHPVTASDGDRDTVTKTSIPNADSDRDTVNDYFSEEQWIQDVAVCCWLHNCSSTVISPLSRTMVMVRHLSALSPDTRAFI